MVHNQMIFYVTAIMIRLDQLELGTSRSQDLFHYGVFWITIGIASRFRTLGKPC